MIEWYIQKMKNEKVRQTFVTFPLQSMDFIPNDTKPHSRLHPDEHHDLTLQLPIHHTLRTILLEFKRQLKQHGYKCIDICEKQILVVRLTLADRARKLFMCQEPPKFIITVNTHEFLSVRETTIKPLKSNTEFTHKNGRQQDLQNQVKKIYQLLVGLTQLFRPQEELLNQLDAQYQQDFYSLDATSYYMFSRMLVDNNYSMGKKMSIVCERFNKESQLSSSSKDELKWLSAALSQMSRDLLQGFNCSRKELLQILAYCRKSVEEYFNTRHNQEIANNGLTLLKESSTFPNETKQLSKYMPSTYRELLKLQSAVTTMDIYKSMFMVGLIFKAQVESKAISEESTGRSLFLIRSCFSGVILQKSRLLLCSGYHQTDYEEFINKFNFDHEITF